MKEVVFWLLVEGSVCHGRGGQRMEGGGRWRVASGRNSSHVRPGRSGSRAVLTSLSPASVAHFLLRTLTSQRFQDLPTQRVESCAGLRAIIWLQQLKCSVHRVEGCSGEMGVPPLPPLQEHCELWAAEGLTACLFPHLSFLPTAGS